jgi:hypothetical protein
MGAVLWTPKYNATTAERLSPRRPFLCILVEWIQLLTVPGSPILHFPWHFSRRRQVAASRSLISSTSLSDITYLPSTSAGTLLAQMRPLSYGMAGLAIRVSEPTPKSILGRFANSNEAANCGTTLLGYKKSLRLGFRELPP